MRSRRGDAQAVAAREVDDLAPQPRDLAPRLGHVAADRRAHLDDGIVHLALDLVFEDLLPLGEHLLDVRAQLARLRIDDLELLFDAEGEGRGHRPSLSRATRGIWWAPDSSPSLRLRMNVSPSSSATSRSARTGGPTRRSRSAPPPCSTPPTRSSRRRRMRGRRRARSS